MVEKFETEIKKEIRLPSKLASIVGEDILSPGRFITTSIKVVDYLRAIGHKINDYRDLHDDGIDNDSQPTFTESIKDAFTKGKKVKEAVEEAVETVEEVAEDIKELVEDVKEDVVEIVEETKDLLETIEEELNSFFEKHIKPLETALASKTDLKAVKKEFITSVNKKVNSNTNMVTNNVGDIAELRSQIEEIKEALKPVEVVEEVKEVEVIDVPPEETIPDPPVEEVKTLAEQAEKIDLTAVDQEKLADIKKLNEEGL